MFTTVSDSTPLDLVDVQSYETHYMMANNFVIQYKAGTPFQITRPLDCSNCTSLYIDYTFASDYPSMFTGITSSCVLKQKDLVNLKVCTLMDSQFNGTDNIVLQGSYHATFTSSGSLSHDIVLNNLTSFSDNSKITTTFSGNYGIVIYKLKFRTIIFDNVESQSITKVKKIDLNGSNVIQFMNGTVGIFQGSDSNKLGFNRIENYNSNLIQANVYGAEIVNGVVCPALATLVDNSYIDQQTGIQYAANGTCYGQLKPNGTQGEDLSSIETLCIPNQIIQTNGSQIDVKRIAEGAFSGLVLMKSASLGQVTEIDDSAFEGCSILSTVIISFACTSIGNSSFKDCSLLDPVLPSSVIELGNSTFENCIAMTSISPYVQKIGNDTYKGCTLLPANITIPAAITQFGTGIFQNCTQITQITIPSAMNVIPDLMFKGCTSLATLNINSDITGFGTDTFTGCAIINLNCSVAQTTNTIFMSGLQNISLTHAGTSLIAGIFDNLAASLKTITIPSTVTSFVDGLFQNFVELTTISLPSDLTAIPDNLFNGCAKLASINIPSAVLTVGVNSFKDCVLLATITINTPSLTVDNTPTDDSFLNCTGVRTLIAETGVTTLTVANYTFWSLLTTLTLTHSSITPSNSMFNGSSLITVRLPNSYTTISPGLFTGSPSVTQIILGNITTTLGATAFAQSGITSIDLPVSVTTVNASSFAIANIDIGGITVHSQALYNTMKVMTNYLSKLTLVM